MRISYIDNKQFYIACKELAGNILGDEKWTDLNTINLYGIPRGGVTVVYALLAAGREIGSNKFAVVDDPKEAHIFVDDILDSGKTADRYKEQYPDTSFAVLYDKTKVDPSVKDVWVQFPYEKADETASIDDNFRRILQYIGEDVNREGLVDTPQRMAKAYAEWFDGYKKKVGDFTSFREPAERYDQMVVLKNIPFYSHCEHHLAPFFGTVSVGYIPNQKVAGLSKLARVVEVYAHRLQVQERLTTQIAECLQSALQPEGVGVIVKARHLCMESRGVEILGGETVTSSLLGNFRKSRVRQEFLTLIGG